MSLQRSISSLQGMWDTGSEDRVICWAGGSDVQAQSGTLLGLVLAFANVFFNASSFVLKKYALRRLHRSGSGGLGGFELGCLLDPVWLLGATLGSSADVAQGLALQFTSSTAVVAIGMANGLVTALLTATLLHEPSSVLVVSCCLLTIVGTLLMVLGVPSEMEPTTALELELYLVQTGFLVYALLVGVVLVLAAGLVSQGGGRRCILLNICVSAWASVPYTIAVKAIVMTVSEVGRLVSLRTAAWFVVVLVSFLAHVIFLNKSLEHFDPVRISQLSSCLLQLSMTATMMLLSRSWQEATPYHALLLLLAVGDVAFALLGFVLFQAGLLLDRAGVS
ncbi:hypothetical protein HPB47_005963 [Ixodes persulcatus]|uniref:Uncharacterized protein n=1 Tax=Ixodes persulcatus TaxID=34615 RepID=A0AC60R2F8_IXOPE|nr:hypothetical protein HPB47_005963 [Ixodes persulcatus]